MTFFYLKNIAIALFAVFLFVGHAPTRAMDTGDEFADHILQGMQKMELAYPQQKVFLHIDKNEYLAGERIWFKAYVVNATTHRPDTMSTNLHVKLLNNKGDIASVLLLRLRNGFAHGDIALPDSLSEGNYQFTAFTDWMQNFDRKFFFQDDIYVYNPIEENFIRRTDVWRNRRFNRQLARAEEEMQFAFFPEGGNFLSGMENEVAFRAVNDLGAGVEATGEVFDGDGNSVLTFETFHNGLGSFSLEPDAGVEYTARITFEDGSRQRLQLPIVQPNGYQLSARQEGDEIAVQVNTNFTPSDLNMSDDVYVMAQVRGRAYFMDKGTLEDKHFSANVPVDILPTGICQISLFTGEGLPIAERMVFINKGDVEMADVSDSQITQNGDYQQMDIDLRLDNTLAPGNYSVSVLDAKDAESDSRSNIATSLLLFGDLGYDMKNPWFYLDPDSEKASRATDLIMMTHGWKRFDMENIVNHDFPEIHYGFPEGFALSGEVAPRSSARKTGEINVELSIHQNDRIYTHDTETNEDGEFVFSNLIYDGEFMAKLRIDTRFDKRAMDIELGGRDFYETQYTNNFHTRPLQVTSRGDDWERTQRPETIIQKRGLIEPGEERTPSMFANADQVIYFDDIRDQYNTVLDVLRTRVRGLRISGGEITMRGPSSVFFTNEPLFLIDETVVNRGAFLNMNVRQIDRLAVMRGPQSAILGARGANGALLIYTLRGDSQWHQSYEYILRGFHEPVETFESKIDTDKFVQYDLDRTLFWEPNLQVDENGKASLSFETDDKVRNVRLIIQGIDEEGRITFDDIIL